MLSYEIQKIINKLYHTDTLSIRDINKLLSYINYLERKAGENETKGETDDKED